MGVELAVMEAFLDETHESLPSTRGQKTYTLGQMKAHNVVVAVILGRVTNRAAAVATQFPLGTVWIGRRDDIRLARATFGGVVQFDMRKATLGKLFQQMG